MVADLSRRACEYRTHVLRMVHGRKSGHIGGAFSCAEILTALYFHHLRVDPARPAVERPRPARLLEGHACAMLYTVLAHRGFFPVDEAHPTFRGLNSLTAGASGAAKNAGSGSGCGPAGARCGHCRGHGAGCAHGRIEAKNLCDPGRRRVEQRRHMGRHDDGGGIFALDNLTVIVDYNGVQQTGTTRHVMPTEPIADKWSAFNWHVIEIHGHNVGQNSRSAGPCRRGTWTSGSDHCTDHEGQGCELHGEFPCLAWRHSGQRAV